MEIRVKSRQGKNSRNFGSSIDRLLYWNKGRINIPEIPNKYDPVLGEKPGYTLRGDM